LCDVIVSNTIRIDRIESRKFILASDVRRCSDRTRWSWRALAILDRVSTVASSILGLCHPCHGRFCRVVQGLVSKFGGNNDRMRDRSERNLGEFSHYFKS